ncbi:glycosyltransferase, partial [Acinetobacter baumannii]
MAKFKPMTTSLRQQLGVSEPTFLLAFAGRVVGWKGLSVAIDAIAQLRDEDVKLLIIGAGDALEQLKNKAMVKG